MASIAYQQIYNIVCQIPPGKVATYGQIARLVGQCTARRVGCALAAHRPQDSDVPWQRVINSQGRISHHGDGIGSLLQRQLLEEEGIIFDEKGHTDLAVFGWLPTVFISDPSPHPDTPADP